MLARSVHICPPTPTASAPRDSRAPHRADPAGGSDKRPLSRRATWAGWGVGRCRPRARAAVREGGVVVGWWGGPVRWVGACSRGVLRRGACGWWRSRRRARCPPDRPGRWSTRRSGAPGSRVLKAARAVARSRVRSRCADRRDDLAATRFQSGARLPEGTQKPRRHDRRAPRPTADTRAQRLPEPTADDLHDDRHPSRAASRFDHRQRNP